MENYPDKRHAASHGIYNTTVEGLYEDYIRPQEHGAHGSCNYVILEDEKLRLTAVSLEAFSFNASCTIAVRNVPLSEASRFGILNTNPDNSIYEFEEKPKQPKSTNASMGIYVFNWKVLQEALIADEDDAVWICTAM